ncbi:RidA family protein [Marinobacterium rhizophilum]|uniref:RidA family protein n=1 Tax=Marinobacterium rhizophilum TaxID=420402 RepID=A0ABY5HLZ4_9GAMM|nr:RidA family protein [Marinobacterium rhizophilum]UTW13425.1 RidA family protein [Marinobacterium rhizophilum]
MTIERHVTTARMSRAVVHKGTLYLCGQVAEDRSAGIAGQTETMRATVDALLTSAGSGRDRILSATIYLRDTKDFAAMNAVWDAWAPAGQAPARACACACVEARMASPESLVEISVIAATDARQETD